MHRRRDVRGHIQLPCQDTPDSAHRDRKSTRLNSSHDQISYAVFCLKKKKKKDDFRHHPRSPAVTSPRHTTHPSHDYPCPLLYHSDVSSVASTTRVALCSARQANCL